MRRIVGQHTGRPDRRKDHRPRAVRPGHARPRSNDPHVGEYRISNFLLRNWRTSCFSPTRLARVRSRPDRRHSRVPDPRPAVRGSTPRLTWRCAAITPWWCAPGSSARPIALSACTPVAQGARGRQGAPHQVQVRPARTAEPCHDSALPGQGRPRRRSPRSRPSTVSSLSVRIRTGSPAHRRCSKRSTRLRKIANPIRNCVMLVRGLRALDQSGRR